MPTHVALLRGVNLGKRQVSMAELRKLLEGLGYSDVSTYVQSGNVVLSTKKAESRIVAELETHLANELGFVVPVILRSRAELVKVVKQNPFARAAADPTKLHVTFLGESPDPALRQLDAADFKPEKFATGRREVYLSLPNGLGRSKLAVAVEKALRGSGTTRNWRTVTTLLDMVDH
jgi:uncharacterized protein (DUF1697 family)